MEKYFGNQPAIQGVGEGEGAGEGESPRRPRKLSRFSLFSMLAHGLLAASASSMLTMPAHAASDTAGQIAAGKVLFDKRCGICHAAPSIGYVVLARRNGEGRAALAERNDLAPEYIAWVARHGLGLMPPFTRVMLTNAELVQVSTYLTRNNAVMPVSRGGGDR
jgi:mono/diheme cytochrome c family protein